MRKRFWMPLAVLGLGAIGFFGLPWSSFPGGR